MTRIGAMKALALETAYGITGTATHDEIKLVAHRWMPQLRFHPSERFHPFALGQYLAESRERQVAPSMWVDVPGGRTEPPVVYRSHDNMQPTLFSSNEVTSDSYFTMLPEGGGSLAYDVARIHFGANTPAGGYFLPRYDVTVLAEFRLLMETLEQNILARLKDPNYDALMDPLRDFGLGANEEQWNKLLALIDVCRARRWPDPQKRGKLLKDLAGVVSEPEWDVIQNFGFLEYYFHYAYNDFDQQTNFIANEHEGDVEGCCLAFDRSDFAMDRTGYDTDTWLGFVKPAYILTSAHNEWQAIDDVKKILLNPSQDRTVWVALGSHASYLSSGEHNLNFVEGWLRDNDTLEMLLEIFPWLAFIAKAIDHFVIPSDETSNDGPHGYADPDYGADPNAIAVGIEVTPLSAGRHVYQELDPTPGDSVATLSERAFPGKWGHHDGGDDSPRFGTKTMRFVKRLARYRVADDAG